MGTKAIAITNFNLILYHIKAGCGKRLVKLRLFARCLLLICQLLIAYFPLPATAFFKWFKLFSLYGCII